MGVPVVPEAGGPRWGTLLLALFLAASQGLVVAFKVDTPYSLYVCPEGQNVTLTCRILDPVSKGHGVTFYKTWYLSSRGEVQVCKERRPIRNFTFHNLHLHHGSHQTANTSQDLAHTHGLESISDHHGNFSIIMHNLTLRDSGLYCCLVVEIKHHYSVHGAIELQVQTGKEAPSKCTAYQSSKQESDNITAAALATGACIVGILCLPLILLLVYRQRQVASHRRAQELVRMDSSNTHGIENPGFESSPPFQGMPEAKTRPPLTYVAQRQPSESGRHLLSEPGTPLSPPGPGKSSSRPWIQSPTLQTLSSSRTAEGPWGRYFDLGLALEVDLWALAPSPALSLQPPPATSGRYVGGEGEDGLLISVLKMLGHWVLSGGLTSSVQMPDDLHPKQVLEHPAWQWPFSLGPGSPERMTRWAPRCTPRPETQM